MFEFQMTPGPRGVVSPVQNGAAIPLQRERSNLSSE
jgi:hypothetical protein